MGNSDCLKSQSSEVSYSPLPVPEFSLTVDKDTGVVGDTLTFTPHLSDGVTGSIVYTVDGAEYTKNIGETFTYKFNKSGNFTVSAVYSGDETHQGATASVSVTINKHSNHFVVSANQTVLEAGETLIMTVTLLDENDKPVPNKAIRDRYNNIKSTNNDGKVTFYHTPAVPQKVELTYDFDGDSNYLPAHDSIMIEWTKKTSVLTCTVDKNSVTVGENVSCTLYLKDNQNNPLANKTVYCEDWSETTNEEGRVIFNYANPSTGAVTKVFKFDGDTSYKGASVTANWTVNKKPVNITVTVDKTSVTVGETVTLTATVKSDGVNVNEGQVDFGDGVLVDVSNGTAVKTFTKTTPTVLTVTPSYKGTSTYTTATASSLTITWIEEQVTPEISISASTLIGEVGDDLPITLSSNLKNTALTVLLNDADVTDSVTTDNTGNAVFNYNCNGAGDVNVKVKYLSGTNVYYSNILQVEDCIKYGFKASDTWVNPTGHSATNTVVDGVFTSTSNSSRGDSILSLDLSGDFIITYDAEWQASTRCGVGAKDTTRTYHFDSGTDSNGTNQKYVSYNGSNETDTIYKNSNIAEYVNCKIIKHNNTLTGYMNNTEVVSVDYRWISQCTVWNFHTTIWGSGRTINIKNLKIKPYSE